MLAGVPRGRAKHPTRSFALPVPNTAIWSLDPAGGRVRLTRRQQRFVDEYLIDLNGTQAAIRAGYSPQTANEIAAENLTKPSVKVAVDQAIAHRANRSHVTQDEVVLELKRIALADPAMAFGPDGAMLELSEMPEDIRRAISSFEVEQRTTEDGQTRTVRRVRFWPKTDALDKLARHLGMLVDRHEDEAKGRFVLNITLAPPEPNGSASDAVVDVGNQLEAPSSPANSLALSPLAANGRGW